MFRYAIAMISIEGEAKKMALGCGDSLNPGDEIWKAAAKLACSHPNQLTRCPVCGESSLDIRWSIADIQTRDADVTLSCNGCSSSRTVRIVLPATASEFYPFGEILTHGDAFLEQVAKLIHSVQEYKRILRAATWMIHPGWLTAGWSAMAYQWHPTSEAPPVLGLSFDNADVGRQLFQSWIDDYGHHDELDEIRVSIIEGDIPGQDPGYSIHICPDPDNSLVRATAEGIALNMLPFTVLGQFRRMHPIPGVPLSLPQFQEEFERHQEFMLAPVTRREDGRLWAVPKLGIIKSVVHFRNVSQIEPGDLDEVIFRTPVPLNL